MKPCQPSPSPLLAAWQSEPICKFQFSFEWSPICAGLFHKKNVTTYRMEYLGLGYTSMRVSLTLVCVSLGLSRAESYTSRVHVGRPVLEGGMRGVQERVL